MRGFKMNIPGTIKRRDFLARIGAAAAAPLVMPRGADAQGKSPPLVGYLSSKGEAAEASTVAAIRKGLADRNFIEGQNVRLAYRWGNGDYSRLPQLAADLVREKVNVIAASGLPAAMAAKAATSSIPIVFRLAIDPVAFHLVQSFDHPGGNITGVTMLFDQLTPKKLQLLHELVPKATTIGLLVNPNNQNAASHKKYAERATAALGLNLSVLPLAGAGGIESAFGAAREKSVGALLVGDDPSFDDLSHELIAAAARAQIPTMYYTRNFVASGGLVSYGPNFDEMARQEGFYLARILEGSNPSELPIQQPTKIDLVINLKAAKALGLAVPPTMLASADEVIE
jgi:putative ABC transport system substrate-binding protein